MAAIRPRSRVPWWIVPVVGAMALIATASVAVLLAGRGRDASPPQPGAFSPPAAAHPAVVADVQQVRSGVLTLASRSGNTEARPPAGVPVYVLTPATAADAAPGDWVTVVGVSNEVLNFAIRQVLIIPAAAGAVPDADGIPRLPAGLAGHEANRDARERPLLAGRVERVEGRTITLSGRAGTMTIDAAAGSPVRRLTAATLGAIQDGDRIAYVPTGPGAGAGEAAALLVLPGAR